MEKNKEISSEERIEELRAELNNDELFNKIHEDAKMIVFLNTKSKYSENLKDLEIILLKYLKVNRKIKNISILLDYKLNLYKHILEIEKLKTKD